MKNKREPPVKTKAGTEAYADQKNCIPVFQRRRYNFRFFNDFYIVYQPLYAIVALQPLNHSLPNNLAA